MSSRPRSLDAGWNGPQDLFAWPVDAREARRLLQSGYARSIAWAIGGGETVSVVASARDSHGAAAFEVSPERYGESSSPRMIGAIHASTYQDVTAQPTPALAPNTMCHA